MQELYFFGKLIFEVYRVFLRCDQTDGEQLSPSFQSRLYLRIFRVSLMQDHLFFVEFLLGRPRGDHAVHLYD